MLKLLKLKKPPATGRLFVLGIFVAGGAILAGCSGEGSPTVEALKAQLSGEHCRFDYPFDRGCEFRDEGFWQWLLREPHHCDNAAVRCLGELKSPAAYDALIGVLGTKTDIETCDGSWSIRTAAVQALGESGYQPAIEPLKRHLASWPTATLSSGASGCQARPEPIAEIEMAIRKLTHQQ